MNSALKQKRKIHQDIEEQLSCKAPQSTIRPFQYIASLFTTEQWTIAEIESPCNNGFKPLDVFI